MLPKIPKGFVTNFPHAVPDFIGPRQFIFLLSCVVIFLLTAVFILDIPQRLQSASNTPPVNFEEVNFPSSRTKDRVLEYIKSASAEKDSNKRFELYRNVYGELLAVYTFDHDSKTRKQAESMSQFISRQFPEKYQASNFTIPCLDLDCGQPNYSEEVLKIKEEIQSIKSIDPLVLESISRKFEAAALSKDTNFQWENYFTALQEIKAEYNRTNDSHLKESAFRLREFLEKNFQANYNIIKSNVPKLLEI